MTEVTVERQVRELLEQMTIEEKIGQLGQRLYGFSVYEIDENGNIFITEEFEREVGACQGLGTLYGLYRADPWSGRVYENGLSGQLAVKTYNELQRYVIEHSRLGIPMLLSSECPHGHQALDGYILPVNLASGASFSPELLKEAATVCGKQLSGMGVDLALVSALDILRDPRWGRSEECFGEDPYLCAAFAKAVVEGIQEQGVGVVAKHFCGQGETTGGVNASAARLGKRELQEIHFPAAKACCEANVKGVMAAYNEIDGVYCHANGELLNDILRKDFGFSGVIMADGIAIDQLDVMTGDNVVSAAVALKAGVDIGLWDEAFSKLKEALERGLIDEADIDRAVARVLKLKAEQGVLEKPYIGPDGKRTAEYPQQNAFCSYSYQEYPQTTRLAEESVVLLKNEKQVLPIKKDMKKIAVIGPNANSIYNQIGDYSPQLRTGEGRTVWEGMCEQERECELRFADGSNLSDAKKVAAWCDLAVLVLGGSSSRFSGAVFDKNGAAIKSNAMQMDCGEGVDSVNLILPGNQMELFTTVRENVTKLVTVVIAGRPYAIPEIAEKTDALLYAFYPGPMGGEAIAKLLYGERTPSGRLPVSLPRSVGQIPVYYNHKKSYQAMHYCNEEDGALFSFGEGIGYSTFSYENIHLMQRKDGVELICTVENTGEYEDATVLQCYRSIRASEVVPRIRELKGFSKVWLKPGERKTVHMQLSEDFFLIYGMEGKWKKQKGMYDVLLMDSGKLIWKGEIECI